MSMYLHGIEYPNEQLIADARDYDTWADAVLDQMEAAGIRDGDELTDRVAAMTPDRFREVIKYEAAYRSIQRLIVGKAADAELIGLGGGRYLAPSGVISVLDVATRWYEQHSEH